MKTSLILFSIFMLTLPDDGWQGEGIDLIY